MYGYYSNKRLTENETMLLYDHPDDYIWYKVILGKIFGDFRLFQVREDIELPQNKDDDGIVLLFEDGSVVYFKTFDGSKSEEEYESIFNVVSFLENKFDCPIDVYLAGAVNLNFIPFFKKYDCNIRIFFSLFDEDNCDEIIEKLKNKLINNEKYTIEDSINHMILPFMLCQDNSVCQEEYLNYMNQVNQQV